MTDNYNYYAILNTDDYIDLYNFAKYAEELYSHKYFQSVPNAVRFFLERFLYVLADKIKQKVIVNNHGSLDIHQTILFFKNTKLIDNNLYDSLRKCQMDTNGGSHFKLYNEDYGEIARDALQRMADITKYFCSEYKNKILPRYSYPKFQNNDNGDYNALAKQYDNLEKECNDKSIELDKAKNQIIRLSSEKQILIQQKIALENNTIPESNKNNQQEDKFNLKLHKELEDIKDENAKLKEEITLKNNLIQGLRNTSTINSSNNLTELDIWEIKKENVRLKAKIREVEEEQLLIQQALKNSTISASDKNNQSEDKSNLNLHNELENTKDELIKYQSLNIKLKAEISSKNKLIQELQNASTLNSSNNLTELDIWEIKKENARLKAKINEAVEEQLSEHIKKVNAEKNTIIKEYKNKLNDIDKHEKYLNEQELKNKNINKQISETALKIKEEHNTLLELEAKYYKTIQQLPALEKSCKEYKNNLKAEQNQNKLMQIQLSSLQAANVSSSETIKMLSEEKEMLQAELTKLKGKQIPSINNKNKKVANSLQEKQELAKQALKQAEQYAIEYENIDMNLYDDVLNAIISMNDAYSKIYITKNTIRIFLVGDSAPIVTTFELNKYKLYGKYKGKNITTLQISDILYCLEEANVIASESGICKLLINAKNI